MNDFQDRKAGLIEELENAAAALAAHPAASPYGRKIEALLDRLQKSNLQLAVLGQFKRGKSTFINALLGAPVLPSAVVPLTAIATYIQWSAVPHVRVRTNSIDQDYTSTEPDKLRDFLFRYIAEEANPQNHLGVSRVDVFFPASILRNRIVLIDTPGVGSTYLHNTRTALQALSESDAVLFVLSADPPISQAEIDYLRRLRKSTQIFFVLNKIDYLTLADRERVISFLKTVLGEHGFPDARIFPVSARQGLEAKLAGDEQALAASGLSEVQSNLVSFLAQEKDQLLQEAMRENGAGILSQAESELRLRLRALTLPLDQLSQKCRQFSERLQAIERESRIAGGVLAGEQRQLREKLEARLASVRKDIYEKLVGLADDSPNWDAARQAVPALIEREFSHAGEKLSSEIAGEVEVVLAEHQRSIHALIDDVRSSAADIFDIPFSARPVLQPFRQSQEPYWVTEQRPASLLPSLDRAFDWLLPGSLRRSSRRSRFLREAENLSIRNTENLRWSLIQGIEETFRAASAEAGRQLADAIAVTNRILEEALALRRSQSVGSEQERSRLSKAVQGVREVRERLLTRSGAGRSADPEAPSRSRRTFAHQEQR